jgi:hypothetical protein
MNNDTPSVDMDIHEKSDSLFTAFKAWFVFVALLALLMLGGSAYVVYLLLVHFGVVA